MKDQQYCGIKFAMTVISQNDKEELRFNQVFFQSFENPIHTCSMYEAFYPFLTFWL